MKPGNVLIGPSYRIAITDFGLTRSLGSRDDAGLIVGTPSYLPPEVIHADHVLDGRADVYSLGVMTYEMMTGQLPFPIETVDEFFAIHQNRVAPPLPSSLRAELSPAIDDAILRAISRDPRERFPTAGAFAYALLDAREEMRMSTPGFRVVIADDDEVFRRMAHKALAYAFPGSDVVAVADGERALTELDRAPTDLALIDLDMPGLNGVELTAAIRGRDEQSSVAILVVTASGGATDWRLLQNLGADGFLVKPLEPLSLVATARRILRN